MMSNKRFRLHIRLSPIPLVLRYGFEYECGPVWHGPFGNREGPMLTFLKTVHTIIWVVMSAANLTAFHLAFVGRFNTWFFLSVTLLGIEVIIIAVNSWHCPLTDVMA